MKWFFTEATKSPWNIFEKIIPLVVINGDGPRLSVSMDLEKFKNLVSAIYKVIDTLSQNGTWNVDKKTPRICCVILGTTILNLEEDLMGKAC